MAAAATTAAIKNWLELTCKWVDLIFCSRLSSLAASLASDAMEFRMHCCRFSAKSLRASACMLQLAMIWLLLFNKAHNTQWNRTSAPIETAQTSSHFFRVFCAIFSVLCFCRRRGRGRWFWKRMSYSILCGRHTYSFAAFHLVASPIHSFESLSKKSEAFVWTIQEREKHQIDCMGAMQSTRCVLCCVHVVWSSQ